MSLRMSYVIFGIAVIALVIWLFSGIKQSCGDLEHTRLDQMDSATKQFYFQNCK